MIFRKCYGANYYVRFHVLADNEWGTVSYLIQILDLYVESL